MIIAMSLTIFCYIIQWYKKGKCNYRFVSHLRCIILYGCMYQKTKRLNFRFFENKRKLFERSKLRCERKTVERLRCDNNTN